MVKKYKVEVISHTKLIDNIYSLEFKSLGRQFKFHPGQFLHLAIDEYDGIGQWPESRCFSMQSAPVNEIIKITYAVKGKFTIRMSRELMTGKEIWLKLPYGNIFESAHNKDKSVFIAGGTGITPFLSLFCDDSFAEYSNSALFFGVRDIKYHLYKNEIEESIRNHSLEVFLFIDSVNGRPELDQIVKVHGKQACFFLSGPQKMIEFYKNSLISEGVDKMNIFSDDWE
jgi:NAD(P)H-flavin reductase